MGETGKKSKKKTGLGLAIWILTFLIILIVFLVKQEEIKSNFEKSGASALIEKKFGKEKTKTETEQSGESEEIVIDLTKNIKKNESVAKSEAEKSETNEAKNSGERNDIADSQTKSEPEKSALPEEKNSKVTLRQSEKSESLTKNTSSNTAIVQKKQQAAQALTSIEKKQAIVEKTTEQPAKTTNTKICFVAIDSDGLVVRKEVSRSVAKESPLAESLKELLKGPSSTEAKTGCQSYIPSESRLLGISIKEGIATLNFNEEFQFNNYGSVGANVQLMQIVYTATNFSTVKKVQFLIEGKKRDYLTEGVWIGSPLSRSSF